MNTLRRLLVGLLLAVTSLWGLAAPASAAEASIAYAERTEDGLTITVDVSADAVPDPDGVTVTIDDVSYPATAAPLSDSGSVSVDRTVVLAIDTSDSMSGERFEAAKTAAQTFLDSVPDDVRVGIITFSQNVQVELDPTTDREAAAAVLDTLALSRGTQLYQAVLDAVSLAGADDGQAGVLLLSDGADTGSLDLDTVVTTVEDSGVVVDAVALDQSGRDLDVLESIAGEDGRVISATSDALAAAFSTEADVLARQIGVQVEAPADVVSDQISVQVTLPSDVGDLVAETTLLPEEGAAPTTEDESALDVRTEGSSNIDVPGWFMVAGVAVFASGLLLLLVLLVPRKPEPMTIADRVSTYTQGGSGPVDLAKPEETPALAQASQAVAEVLKRNRGLDERISQRLAAAGSELKSSEWLLIHAAVFVLSTLLGLAIGRGNVVVGVLFMILGAVVPWVILGFRRSRRRKAFNALLPDTLQLLSSSMSAGLSLMQSVDTIVREGAEPVRSEFKRVLVENRLGVSIEDALDGVADRFDSHDFRWVVMAIRIQRQVGGNLAALLDTVAATMREREYMRRQVAALAAEGKLSAIVLGGLPPAFLLYLTVTRYDYVAPLFTDPRGWVMLGGATLWLGVGVFWMSRLVKVEV